MLANYGWLAWIIIGFLAGGIAKLVMPGKDPGGCVVTVLLGIGGALVAGFIGRALGFYTEPMEGAGFLAAILGAVLILILYRLLLKRRR